MLSRIRSSTAVLASAVGVWGMLALTPAARCASPFPAGGAILGVVSDAGGRPQMGATVLLFDRFEKLARKALTDEKGGFSFQGLALGVYSLHVSLASFVPVTKSNLMVQPGSQSLFNISLAGLFSSIDFVAPAAGNRAIMSDDWKWVLRTANSTRPVLRLLPGWDPLDDSRRQRSATVFSGTTGVVRVSGGDGGMVAGGGQESDLGTAFALATSLYGSNQLSVAGNVGYASESGLPSAGFRTSYSRGDGVMSSPEVSVTMRQLFIPGRVAGGIASTASLPALRTLSLSVDDGMQLTDGMRIDYGFALDSVAFFDRLNYASPYARLSYALSDDSTLRVGYSSGVPRIDSPAAPDSGEMALQNDIRALALFPRVSRRDGRARVQRADNLEISYEKQSGKRLYQVGVFRENVANAALTVLGADGYESRNFLPDPFSNSGILNAGAFSSAGYMAAVSQHLAEELEVTVMFASGGALVSPDAIGRIDGPGDVRSAVHQGWRRTVTFATQGRVPRAGTLFTASYQLADRRAATPAHFYFSQRVRSDTGLNVLVRQPLPMNTSMPFRMEATADLRNLLAQGYLPVPLADGNRLILMSYPRSVRGGLSFIF